MRPPKHRSILNPAFVYYSSADTNVARTFARIRRQMKQEAEAKAARQHQVLPMARKAKQ